MRITDSMEKVYIFCDEYGTSALHKKDVKNITKFVYCCIVLKESNLKKARVVRNEISQKFLFNQKIKSSSKALKNNDRRLNCLNYLYNNLDFISHFLIVDKDKLEQDKGGLRFKEVFYKFFQKIFFAEINNRYDDFEINMHHTINDEYGEDLKQYLSKEINSSLFENYNFLSDDDEPLIQFSDLIAGSFGKCFNKDFESEIDDEIFKIIQPNIQSSTFFPPEYKNNNKPLRVENLIDKDIYNIVRKDASDFLDKENDIILEKIIEQLLWYQKVAPNVYLQTYELINHLKYHLGKDVTTESLRLIIRDLRFEGLIIVSANHKSGYKLAVSKSDIYEYFNHYSKYILPMLKKVQIANDILKQKTVGEFKPIEDFDDLNSLLLALNNLKNPDRTNK